MEQQARTRRAVLEAARSEFAERGFIEAKIDRIADRADLTRGAVYSNFASKRALYLAVLLDTANSDTPPTGSNALPLSDDASSRDAASGGASSGSGDGGGLDGAGRIVALDVAGAVEAFARTWLERLPLAYGDTTAGRLQARSLTGVFDEDPRGRAVLAQITRLESLLLAVALESCRARTAGRRVRLAELILTMLHGAAGLAETAPGFGDAFDVARACRHLAGLDLADEWDPPYLPYVHPARLVREAWIPPGETIDELSGRPFTVGDGMIVALGPGRIGGAEDAVRAARPGEIVTIAAVIDDPAETGALVRLRLTDLTANLRRLFGPAYHPSLRLVLDDTGALASAVGVTPAFDTEVSIRVSADTIVNRAEGPGAAYATATARDSP